MHPDLTQHLHSEKCNELILALQKCHEDNPLTKFFGKCNSEDTQMNKCLKQERRERQQKNYEKSVERKRKLQEYFRNEHEATK